MHDLHWIAGRAFADYRLWECYRAGLYLRRSTPPRVAAARAMLADSPRFRDTALEGLREWPISSRVHLTDPYRNHRPYLGRAACCRDAGATEWDTRIAWGLLNPDEQRRANAVADDILAHVELIWTPERYPRPNGPLEFPW